MKLCDFYYQEISPGVQKVKGFFPEEFVGLQTSRAGGVSAAPFDSFNLATHVGDEPKAVAENRARLRGFLPADPVWLDQVHGCDAVVIGPPRPFGPPDDDQTVIARSAEGATWQSADGGPEVTRADASITGEPNQPCVVMTADCLPLLVARPSTGQCAAIHAGWKGLAAGVIEKALGQMSGTAPDTVPDIWCVFLGPAIGQNAFEVGPEVHEKFVQQDPQSAAAFLPSARQQGHFMASLIQLALLRLKTFESVNPGAELRVAIDRDCVFENPQRFFSFRRNSRTGRMASLIFRRIDQKA